MEKFFLNHRKEWVKIDCEKDIFVPENHFLKTIKLKTRIKFFISKNRT